MSDWTGDIGDGSLPAIMRLANAHEKVCDGKPQPKPEPRPSAVSAGFMPALWSEVILDSLVRSHLAVTPPPGALRVVTRQPEL